MQATDEYAFLHFVFFFLFSRLLIRQQSTSTRSAEEDTQTKRMRLPSDTSSEYGKVLSPSHCQDQCNCERCQRITIIDLD